MVILYYIGDKWTVEVLAIALESGLAVTILSTIPLLWVKNENLVPSPAEEERPYVYTLESYNLGCLKISQSYVPAILLCADVIWAIATSTMNKFEPLFFKEAVKLSPGEVTNRDYESSLPL